jgi:hypothetical protein
MQTRQSFSTTQAGQNRFFMNEGFKVLKPEQCQAPDHIALRAVRGYFTSIRPGSGTEVFLNINTATSTFFPPCRVSDIIDYVTNSADVQSETPLDDLDKWLKGGQLRVAYTRQDLPNRSVSINDPKSRLKTFQNFGYAIGDQTFQETILPNAPGRTILNYFQNGTSV